jgi:hypothetical protein
VLLLYPVKAVGKGGMSCGWSGGGGGHGPNAVGTGGIVVQTGRLMGGPQRFQIFSNLSKTGSNLKINLGPLSSSKNSQFLYATSWQHWE